MPGRGGTVQGAENGWETVGGRRDARDRKTTGEESSQGRDAGMPGGWTPGAGRWGVAHHASRERRRSRDGAESPRRGGAGRDVGEEQSRVVQGRDDIGPPHRGARGRRGGAGRRDTEGRDDGEGQDTGKGWDAGMLGGGTLLGHHAGGRTSMGHGAGELGDAGEGRDAGMPGGGTTRRGGMPGRGETPGCRGAGRCWVTTPGGGMPMSHDAGGWDAGGTRHRRVGGGRRGGRVWGAQ